MSNFATAVEQFDDEEYDLAVTSLTKALDECDDNNVRAKILAKRASAHLQLSLFENSAEDATACLTLSPENQSAWLSKGEAMFNMEEYETAKVSFEKGLKVKGNTGKKAAVFQKWINKCDAELEDEVESQEEEEEEKVEATKTESSSTTTTPPPSPPPPATTVPNPPKFRHDWYQTFDAVVVTVMAKKQKSENVSVDITQSNLTIEIKLDDGSGSSFVLDLDLFDNIDPSQSSHRLSPFKLEVTLRKKESYQWTSLEASDATLAARIQNNSSSGTVPVSSTSVPSAYASKKDWNAIERQIKKEEEEEKPEGEEALNALFRQIYGNASDATRRAMNKSFQTSGGTVLSTNWDEVGKTDYEKDRQAPEGMEWKNWNGARLDKEGNPIKDKKK
jgi:tetratricopeptide (TPR) repeat protein